MNRAPVALARKDPVPRPRHEQLAGTSWNSMLQPPRSSPGQPQAWEGNIRTWRDDWAEQLSLELGPETNEAMWDGTPVDYDAAVGVLADGEGIAMRSRRD